MSHWVNESLVEWVIRGWVIGEVIIKWVIGWMNQWWIAHWLNESLVNGSFINESLVNGSFINESLVSESLIEGSTGWMSHWWMGHQWMDVPIGEWVIGWMGMQAAGLEEVLCVWMPKYLQLQHAVVGVTANRSFVASRGWSLQCTNHFVSVTWLSKTIRMLAIRSNKQRNFTSCWSMTLMRLCEGREKGMVLRISWKM